MREKLPFKYVCMGLADLFKAEFNRKFEEGVPSTCRTAYQRSNSECYGYPLHELSHALTTKTTKTMGWVISQYTAPKKDFDEIEAVALGHVCSKLLGYPTSYRVDLQNGGLRVIDFKLASRLCRELFPHVEGSATQLADAIHEYSYLRMRNANVLGPNRRRQYLP